MKRVLGTFGKKRETFEKWRRDFNWDETQKQIKTEDTELNQTLKQEEISHFNHPELIRMIEKDQKLKQNYLKNQR